MRSNGYSARNCVLSCLLEGVNEKLPSIDIVGNYRTFEETDLFV